MNTQNTFLKNFAALFIFGGICFILGFAFSVNAPVEPVNNPRPLPIVLVDTVKNFLIGSTDTVNGSNDSTNRFDLFTGSKNIEDLNMDPVIQAYNDIKTNYYGFSGVEKKKITEGMIRGMTESLGDKHTMYFNKEESEDFNESIAGNFEGIGAFVGKTQSGVLIRHVFDGSPAKDAKILDGDIVTHVNGEEIYSYSLEDAVKKIRGPAGTPVKLTILRHGEKNDEKLEFSVVRRSVKIPSVIADMDSSKIAHVTIGVFGVSTTEDFLREYLRLQREGMKGMIIDLRDNPGGLLHTAIGMLENFVPSGQLILETRGVREELTEKFFSEGTPLGKKIPIVVLVNENSASASEIFAGALQEYNLAVIVGNRTYGKGSVQEIFNLDESGEIKITIAKWYTPKGNGIDGVGILPDVVIPVTQEDIENKKDAALITSKELIEKLFKGESIDAIRKKYEDTKKLAPVKSEEEKNK